ncbi:ATP-dependent DNA helicase [Frankliniella fusca]|uniref:ATP-dependent DNA helicase n=1 Tax=Frankliniella fusca TaxID=407009 RepID=A0AAE1H9M6_9NEOP|nr:ATP-dependent DNA helicase [Frankliniella fusca]
MKKGDDSIFFKENDAFKDAIRLFPMKVAVEETNKEILSRLRCKITNNPVPIARIKGRHNCSSAAVAPAKDADGLEPELYLAKGAKVMMKKNLWTDMGLVNGAIGEVVDIVFEDGKFYPNDSPSVILCKFPQYKGPTLTINGVCGLIPISPSSKMWSSKNGKSLSRVQFPLTLAYACSIHKSQGLTLQQAVVDIGSMREMFVGLSYVALSRCTTLEGILLVPFSFNRFQKINKSSALQARLLAEEEIFKKKLC